MSLQEIGLIPILSNRFSGWTLLEVEFFLCAIGGASLRLWCFKCLQKFFTFNVTVKKDHKLITTGPYSLLVHPAVSIFVRLFCSVFFLLIILIII
jgi:protein-S-isoprenylcysteine O-methyltransferase Ste14